MTPTSPLAGLLTGLVDGLVIAAIVFAVVVLVARRRTATVREAARRPLAGPAARTRSPLAERDRPRPHRS